MKEQLEQKLTALVDERQQILSAMEQMRSDFEACKERVIQLNGSIEATQEAIKIVQVATDNGTNCEAETGSDTDGK